MLNRIIDFSLAYRWLVLLGVVALLGVGGYALYTIPVEAFPDLTNNQVVIVTEAPSLPPEEVEQLVTYPLERAMLGLPNKEEVRSLSKLGLSMVTIVFDDSVPMYFARQLVAGRLQQTASILPQGGRPAPELPPTALGELCRSTPPRPGRTPPGARPGSGAGRWAAGPAPPALRPPLTPQGRLRRRSRRRYRGRPARPAGNRSRPARPHP